MQSDDTFSSQPVFLRTDARQRRNLALLSIGLLVFAVLFFSVCMPALKGWVFTGYTDTVVHRFALVCYAIATLMLVVAACVAGYARRVLRSGQFPLAGTWVFNDTRLQRGAAARAYAWGMLGVAACCVLLAIYVVTLPHRMGERLLHSAPTQPAPLQLIH